jgi:hypothetical protein
MVDSLRVESGECIILSPKSPLYKKNYRQVRPRTAKEVREVIGLSEEMTKAIRAQGVCCHRHTNLPTTISTADLDSEDKAVRTNAMNLTHKALRAYVTSVNPAFLAHMEPAIGRYLDIVGLVLNIVSLKNTIEVADGATLIISDNTHLVEASKIIIHGTGKIKCSGLIKFNVASIEGI